MRRQPSLPPVVAARSNAPQAGRTSRFKGVGLHAQMGRWRARVLVRGGGAGGDRVTVGYGDSEEAAAELINAAAYVLGDRCAFSLCLASSAEAF